MPRAQSLPLCPRAGWAVWATLTLSLLAVPPVPLTAPRLLAKQSRQLVVSPLVSFSGDGPIASVRLHYRPQDSTMAWSTIVGEGARARGRMGCQTMRGSEGWKGVGSVRRREGLRESGGFWTELGLNAVCCAPCPQWTPVRT